MSDICELQVVEEKAYIELFVYGPVLSQIVSEKFPKLLEFAFPFHASSSHLKIIPVNTLLWTNGQKINRRNYWS